MKIVYSDRQVSDPGDQPIAKNGYAASPSARKPKELAALLASRSLLFGAGFEFVEPSPVSIDDFKLCHDQEYVDAIVGLKAPNGFGTISQSVIDSLPYTNGAMLTAARLATATHPTCALVSGFHHAGYKGWRDFGWFCTFNGLMVTAAKLLAEGKRRICILDCDMHWGNGTDDILSHLPYLYRAVEHFSFGRFFLGPSRADTYLDWLNPNGIVYSTLEDNRPDVILYQAGADVHVNDPYGGVLTTEQMYERDLRVFTIAKSLGIPLAWNLAGGYQTDQDGKIDIVLGLHLNTFKACFEVYGSI